MEDIAFQTIGAHKHTKKILLFTTIRQVPLLKRLFEAMTIRKFKVFIIAVDILAKKPDDYKAQNSSRLPIGK